MMENFFISPNEIFVFGSNRQGIHGRGAARTALLHYGAISGRGEGRQGNSYALPTKSTPWKSLELFQIKRHVLTFLDYANNNPDQTFIVTRIGCGLAGYKDQDIAPMFRKAPSNCNFEHAWFPYLGD